MATSDILTKTGIVLRLAETKENDAVVLALGEEGLFSFYARGIRKLSSSNAPGTQLLSESSFVLVQNSGGELSLKEASPICSYYPKENLSAFAIASLILELTTKLLSPEDSSSFYPWAKASLAAIKEGKDPFVIGLLYFAHVLIALGIGLDVEECVACGSRSSIAGISYEEGGFLCKECALNTPVDSSSRSELKILHYIFRAPSNEVGRVELGAQACLPIYEHLSHYLEENMGVKLKSLDLIVSKI